MPSLVKSFREGTHRTVSPGDTVAGAIQHAIPLGITRVANVTGLDCIGVPVVLVYRPNARSLAVSGGKGLDLTAARASGLMEAVELYHAEHIALPLKLGSLNELRFTHHLVDVTGLPRTSISPFHPDHQILWVEGADLFSADCVWVPFELVHANYTIPLPTGSGCFVLTSNGLASGNHLLEAIVHGLCELIERDATTLFLLKRTEQQDARRVELGTISDPSCRSVLDLYQKAGVMVGVWETTSDVSVPSFACLIADGEPNPFRPIGPVSGYGCHPSRDVALLRALTEAAQGRLILITGSREDNDRAMYAHLCREDTIQRARDRLRAAGQRSFDEAPTRDRETLQEDLADILAALSSAGLKQAVAVDLTKREFGIPVVRVMVPGLEAHCHVQGYVPGERARRFAAAAQAEAAES